MDRTERLYRIDLLLNERKVVPVGDFLAELGVSLATFKRDLEYLRDRLNAPVVWDKAAGGYRFDQQGVGDKYELPGLWFNASEIHALLTMQQLLNSLGPGLLTPHVEPLLSRLRMLLDREGVSLSDVQQRIRIQRTAARTYESDHFAPIAGAVLQRRRVSIEHYNRDRGELLVREISPQRINHYRENWYVDAWCHLRNGLRSFALDAIQRVQQLDVPALEVSDAQLAEELDGGYGIFSGKDVQWGILRFSAERARWVSKEIWHPAQTGEWNADGSYTINVPFSSMTELLMDVQRHVPAVTVIAPPALKAAFRESLMTGLASLGCLNRSDGLDR